MPARSSSAIAVALLIVAACSPAAPASAPVGTQGAQTSTAPSVAATRPPASPRPTPRLGAFENPDGSVYVGTRVPFGFAQPGDGAIWGIFQHDGVRDIVRLDPQTLEFETVVGGLPILVHPVAPVAANGFIWLASDPGGTVQQYDAATGELVREITTGPIGVEPVVAYGDVWTLNHGGDSVTRIDVDTGDTRSVQLPGARPLLLTPVDDELLLVSDPGPTTWVVDPERMELIGTYEAAACYDEPGWLGSAFDGVLWRKRCNEDVVDVLDPRTGKVLDTFESPVHANLDPLPVDGILWFTTEADNTRGYLGLAGLDPRTREIVATYQATERITEGWAFAAFDAWWRWGDEGVLRVPADTLRAAAG